MYEYTKFTRGIKQKMPSINDSEAEEREIFFIPSVKHKSSDCILFACVLSAFSAQAINEVFQLRKFFISLPAFILQL
jgi:hypothetical protein